MLPYFPKQFSNRAVCIYLLSLALVSFVFWDYAIAIKYVLIGFSFILLFFYGSNSLSLKWKKLNNKDFAKKLFLLTLFVNIIWVTFSYFFYISETGDPFEWVKADAWGYHTESMHLRDDSWPDVWSYLMEWYGLSDTGFFMWLTFVYKIFGPNIFVARLFNALFKAVLAVTIYKLSSRNFGENVGRMSGVFCMLMPNFIVYSGIHLKESLMVMLAMLYLERADILLRSKHYSFLNIASVILLALSLFMFRTVLGSVAIISFFVGLLFTSTKIVSKTRKVFMIIMGVVLLAMMTGGRIYSEAERYWNERASNQDNKRIEQTSRGNQWAKYATATVMAPMIYVVPFSTMVTTEGQETQLMLHSGNFVKNFLGVFVLFALVYVVFIDKNWRNYSLIGSFAVGYLAIIAVSAFANAERFHQPTLPLILMFAAYGVSKVNAKNYKYVKYWSLLVIVMEFGWAFFKLGSRGIVGF